MDALWHLLLIYTGCVWGQSVTTSPASQASVQGGTVGFTCAVSSVPTLFEWRRYTAVDPVEGVRVYDLANGIASGVDTNKYEVTGQYTLTIKSVTIEDAGRYECFLYSQDIRESATLIIVDTPSLSVPGSLADGSEARITCSVQYGAPPRDNTVPVQPTLELKSGVSPISATVSPPSGTGPYTISTNATMRVGVDDHDKNITCTALAEPGLRVTAHRLLQVKHPVTRVTFSPTLPEGATIGADQTLTCVANGHPTPVYTWRALSVPGLPAGTEYRDAELALSLDWVGQNRWSCEAYNADGRANGTAAFILVESGNSSGIIGGCPRVTQSAQVTTLMGVIAAVWGSV